jgi:hypothetical protein
MKGDPTGDGSEVTEAVKLKKKKLNVKRLSYFMFRTLNVTSFEKDYCR